jgi:hypothetical protein
VSQGTTGDISGMVAPIAKTSILPFDPVVSAIAVGDISKKVQDIDISNPMHI